MLIIKYETTGEDIHSFLKYVLIRTELSNKKNNHTVFIKLELSGQMQTLKEK